MEQDHIHSRGGKPHKKKHLEGMVRQLAAAEAREDNVTVARKKRAATEGIIICFFLFVQTTF